MWLESGTEMMQKMKRLAAAKAWMFECKETHESWAQNVPDHSLTPRSPFASCALLSREWAMWVAVLSACCGPWGHREPGSGRLAPALRAAGREDMLSEVAECRAQALNDRLGRVLSEQGAREPEQDPRGEGQLGAGRRGSGL